MKQSRIAVGLVEDIPFIRTFIRKAVASMKSFTLSLEAPSAEDLLKSLDTQAEPPKILVADIGLSGMNGYELMKALQKRRPLIPVVALSVYRDPFAVIQMIRLGARGFVEKERMDELEAALECVRDGGVYFSGGIPTEWIRAAVSGVKPVMLTGKEKQALRLCAGGYTFSQIADTMSVCEKTAHEYKSKIFRKLNVHNGSSMIRKAMATGLLGLAEPLPSWEEEMDQKKRGKGGLPPTPLG
jgi:DNA-binding NarL/FixJ family response regulator